MEARQAVRKKLTDLRWTGGEFSRNGVAKNEAMPPFHQEERSPDNSGVLAKLKHFRSFRKMRMNGGENTKFPRHVVCLGRDGANRRAPKDPLHARALDQIRKVRMPARKLFDAHRLAKIRGKLNNIELFSAADGGCVRLHLISLSAKR